MRQVGDFLAEAVENAIRAYFLQPRKTIHDVSKTAQLLYDLRVRGLVPQEMLESLYKIGILIYHIGSKLNVFKGPEEDAQARILIHVLVTKILADDIMMSYLIFTFEDKLNWNQPTMFVSGIKEVETYVWHQVVIHLKQIGTICVHSTIIPAFIMASCATLPGGNLLDEMNTLAEDQHAIGSELFGRLNALRLDGLKTAYFTEQSIQPQNTSWVFSDDRLLGKHNAVRDALIAFDPRLATIRLGIGGSFNSLEPKKSIENSFGISVDAYRLPYTQILEFHLLDDGELYFDHFGVFPVRGVFERHNALGFFELLNNVLLCMYFDLTTPEFHARQARIPVYQMQSNSSRDHARTTAKNVFELVLERWRIIKNTSEIEDEREKERIRSEEFEQQLSRRSKKRGPNQKDKPFFIRPVKNTGYCAPDYVQDLYRKYYRTDPDERLPVGWTFVHWGILDNPNKPELVHAARRRKK